MRSNVKLAAFTILEMVITMMVSALLIGLAFTAYVIVYRSYLAFEKKNGETSIIIQLSKTLQRDFARSRRVCTRPDGLVIYGQDSIFYEFRNDYMLRRSARSDTFHVEIQNLEMTFENKLLTTSSADSLVDRLFFQLLLRKDTIPFSYRKFYSSEELFNN
ncbi:type II secretory pathway component PulJ [Mucilaginibacter sp. UYNi724]